MRHVLWLLILSLFWAGSAEAAQEKQSEIKGASDAVNAFALDVYDLLAEGGKENIFFSPYSISSALAMTYAGAGGETALEMANALRFSEIRDTLHESMKTLNDRLNGFPEEIGSLAVANRLWLSKEEKLLLDYILLIKNYYASDVVKLDFLKNPGDARLTINGWVEERTHNRIRDLLQEGDVNPTTRLVLTNAIYFKSAWSKAFGEENTKDLPFHTGKRQQKNVATMNRTDSFLYGEADGVQFIKIPYRLPGFSMMILLPRMTEDFTQLEVLEKRLANPAVLKAWEKEMQYREVRLWLPKFKDEQRFLLKDVLQKLGMNLAFDEKKADFSKMVESDDVFIDSVIHQAFIEADEKGTEAAAATVVIMAMRAVGVPSGEKPIEFRADHPFVYFIMDDESGTILFMGRMMKP